MEPSTNTDEKGTEQKDENISKGKSMSKFSITIHNKIVKMWMCLMIAFYTIVLIQDVKILLENGHNVYYTHF